MDAEGNICSMVHTANAFPWGSGIFVEGSALPNSAAIQPAITILATPPGGRVASPTQPILFVSESVKTAISTIGSGLHPYTVQLIPRLFNWMTSPKAGADGSFYGIPDYINNAHSTPHLLSLFSLSLSLSLSRSLFRYSLILVYHTRSLTRSLTHSRSLIAFSIPLTHTLSHSRSPTRSHSHTHALSHSLTHEQNSQWLRLLAWMLSLTRCCRQSNRWDSHSL